MLSCIYRYPMPDKRVPRSAMVEAVHAVSRAALSAAVEAMEKDVQQCLHACPRSLRVKSRGEHVSQVNAVRQTDR